MSVVGRCHKWCWLLYLVIVTDIRLTFSDGKHIDRQSHSSRERVLRQTNSSDPRGHDDPQTPLLLTPLIDAGQLLRARTFARVDGIPGMRRESYSGFLTARAEDEANYFFWFFPAEVNATTAPVVLWLNGGPGASSLAGLFAECGPYTVTPRLRLKYRDHNWATILNMVFVDSPVGTGFSFAKSVENYRNSSEAIGQDLYKVMAQFFTLFNQYSNNDFYVVGESYGAKYASWLAKIIHDRNGEAAQKINLKGIVANSGFLNAYELTHFSDYLFQVGLFSPGQYVAGQLIEARIRGAIQSGDLRQASTVLLEYMVGSATSNNVSFLSMATGLTTSDNILFTESPPVFRHFQEFVQLPVVRRAIHVAQREFVQYNPQVMNALIDEFVTNVTTILEELINVGYKVLMMSGNLDQYVVPVVYNRIANGLTWKYAESFRNSSRIIWKVDPTDVDVAGYSNCAFNLCLVMVRNAGHRMPYDQIRSTLDAVRRFVHDLPFN